MRVEFARRLWEENRPVPWPDVNLPGGGWYLNSRRVPVPPVPEQGREQREEVRRNRTVLLPDLRDDPAFAVTSYNWITFGTWEFDPRRRAGYLGDASFFDTSATDDDAEDDGEDDDEDDGEDDEEDEDNDEDGGEDEEGAGGDLDFPGGDDGVLPWDPAHQPLDIDEDQALQIAMARSELEELGRWDGLIVQLRESSLLQGRPATPPGTPPRDPLTPPAWDPWPASPLASMPPPPEPWSPWPQACVPPPPAPATVIVISSDEE